MMNIFNKDNFEDEVIKTDMPVIVDFYADWCGPCKMMAPVMAQVAGEYKDKIKFGKINIDENTPVAMEYRVMSIPTLLFFKDGKVVGKLEGAVPKTTVDQKIQRIFEL